MRFLLATCMVLGGVLSALACASSDLGRDGQPLCDAGENIFCRCPGGEAGTKTCRDDGQSFDPCVGRWGACEEDTSATSTDPGTTTTTTDPGPGGGGPGGGGPGGGGTTGPGAELYMPCGAPEDCASHDCRMGYCTKPCSSPEDCFLGGGECVRFNGGNQLCMANCVVQADCDVYGSPSTCGFSDAIDGFPVTTCGDWEEGLALPPEGSSCHDDLDCNLGHLGKQAVCAFDTCTQGCYGPEDCPTDTTCTSQGAIGRCE